MPKQAKEEIRSRKFCITTYIEPTYIYQFLKRSEWVQHYALCTHDKDITDDGTPKESHTHVLIYTYNAKTATAIKKLFDRYSAECYKDTETEPQNSLVQVCFDIVTQWRYLIHKDNPEKARYCENERICDDFSYWNKLEKSSAMNDCETNFGFAMLKDYMDGVHPLEMAHRYGKEYIYHLAHFQRYALEIHRADIRADAETLNKFNLRELMHITLEGAPFPKEQIFAFWNVYEYIITQINANYNSKIDFYLTEKENYYNA